MCFMYLYLFCIFEYMWNTHTYIEWLHGIAPLNKCEDINKISHLCFNITRLLSQQ